MKKSSVKSLAQIFGTLVVMVALTGGMGCGKGAPKEEAPAPKVEKKAEAGGPVKCNSFSVSKYFMSFSACADDKYRAVLCSEKDGKFSCRCKFGDDIQKTFDLTEAPYSLDAEFADKKVKAIALAKSQCGFDIQ